MDDRDHATRLVLARLQGVVMHHARWEPLSEDEMAAAVAEVAEVDEVLAGPGRRAEADQLPGTARVL